MLSCVWLARNICMSNFYLSIEYANLVTLLLDWWLFFSVAFVAPQLFYHHNHLNAGGIDRQAFAQVLFLSSLQVLRNFFPRSSISSVVCCTSISIITTINKWTRYKSKWWRQDKHRKTCWFNKKIWFNYNKQSLNSIASFQWETIKSQIETCEEREKDSQKDVPNNVSFLLQTSQKWNALMNNIRFYFGKKNTRTSNES